MDTVLVKVSQEYDDLKPPILEQICSISMEISV